MEPLVEERDDGQHRAGLDDDVKQIRLAGNEMLGNEKVAGGGNGQELRHSFDDAQDNSDQRVGHGFGGKTAVRLNSSS
jgi:hypothetical protein